MKVGLSALNYFWLDVFQVVGHEVKDLFTAMEEDGDEIYAG